LIRAFKLIKGSKAVDLFKFLIESFTPGAITPPSYTPFLITSNVVAVPKSKTKQFLNFFAPIAFAILSEPNCFLFLTLIFIILFKFKFLFLKFYIL
jgi:hypothetical protein